MSKKTRGTTKDANRLLVCPHGVWRAYRACEWCDWDEAHNGAPAVIRFWDAEQVYKLEANVLWQGKIMIGNTGPVAAESR